MRNYKSHVASDLTSHCRTPDTGTSHCRTIDTGTSQIIRSGVTLPDRKLRSYLGTCKQWKHRVMAILCVMHPRVSSRAAFLFLYKNIHTHLLIHRPAVVFLQRVVALNKLCMHPLHHHLGQPAPRVLGSATFLCKKTIVDSIIAMR